LNAKLPCKLLQYCLLPTPWHLQWLTFLFNTTNRALISCNQSHYRSRVTITHKRLACCSACIPLSWLVSSCSHRFCGCCRQCRSCALQYFLLTAPWHLLWLTVLLSNTTNTTRISCYQSRHRCRVTITHMLRLTCCWACVLFARRLSSCCERAHGCCRCIREASSQYIFTRWCICCCCSFS
jgi:hypothetical protein